MDQTLRTLGRAAARNDDDHETQLRLAVAQVRNGALVALTQLVLAPPRKLPGRACARPRSQPKLFLLREPDGGDLTPRARNAVLQKVLGQLGRPGIRARWTPTAGCACRCSPAYILRGRGTEDLGDVYARVLVATSERLGPPAAREPWRPALAPTPTPVVVSPPPTPPVRTVPPAWPSAFLASADHTLPPTRVGTPPTAPTPAASPATDRRLPPVGTLLRKLDRQGRVRCQATVDTTGVWFQGTRYPSLSAAALAAARSLGLAAKSLNGWAWWGLENPRRVPRRPTKPVSPATPTHAESACAACGGRHGLLRCPDMGR